MRAEFYQRCSASDSRPNPGVFASESVGGGVIIGKVGEHYDHPEDFEQIVGTSRPGTLTTLFPPKEDFGYTNGDRPHVIGRTSTHLILSGNKCGSPVFMVPRETFKKYGFDESDFMWKKPDVCR